MAFKGHGANEHGFTLLEILIAITLLAFITLGVVNITENAVNTMERTGQVNKNNLQVETALSRFEWDFSQIYSPLYFSKVMSMNPNLQNPANPGETNPNPQGAAMSPELQAYYETLVQRFERNEHFSSLSQEGLPIPRFYSPERDVFEFFTSSNRRKVENTKQSHFAWVRYSLATPSEDKDPDDVNPNIPKSLKNLVRYYNADDPYGDKRIDIEDDRTKGSVLLENVESLQFQFWEPRNKKWETSLRSVQGGESLLRGVKIIIEWYDYSGNKREMERIFRTNWPMVVPQDPAPQAFGTPITTAGSTSGNTAGNTAGDPAGTTAGSDGGTNTGGTDGDDE